MMLVQMWFIQVFFRVTNITANFLIYKEIIYRNCYICLNLM